MLNHFFLPWVGHLLSVCERKTVVCHCGVPGESQEVGEEGDLGCDSLATTGGRGLVLAYDLFELITTFHLPFHISLTTI